jgi:hypothetical protein
MKVLGFLPGYMWVNGTLRSTGAAIPPTQHLDPETGDTVYYVRPFFVCGPTVGLFIRRSGLVRAIAEGRA